MKLRHVMAALAVLNLLLLMNGLAQARSRTAQAVETVRARAFELVDHGGQVRYRLSVESDGEVVLRLLDQAGTIRVKLGAGRDGSGLVLLNDATEPGVQVLAKAAGSSLKLVNKGGRERVLAP